MRGYIHRIQDGTGVVGAKTKGARVLIVEDNPDHATLTKVVLSKSGFHQIDMVDTISSAFNLIKTNHYKLIIVDYRLPDGEGLDLLDWVTQDCTAIMMTNKGNEKVAAEAFRRGAADYIVKDVLFREVLTDVATKSVALLQRVSKGGTRRLTSEKRRLRLRNPLRSLKPAGDQSFGGGQEARTPLTDIRDCLHSIANSSLGRRSKKRQKMLQHALESCNSLAGLVGRRKASKIG